MEDDRYRYALMFSIEYDFPLPSSFLSFSLSFFFSFLFFVSQGVAYARMQMKPSHFVVTRVKRKQERALLLILFFPSRFSFFYIFLFFSFFLFVLFASFVKIVERSSVTINIKKKRQEIRKGCIKHPLISGDFEKEKEKKSKRNTT